MSACYYCTYAVILLNRNRVSKSVKGFFLLVTGGFSPGDEVGTPSPKSRINYFILCPQLWYLCLACI